MIRVAVTFTQGMTLAEWGRLGIRHRELGYLADLGTRLGTVDILAYDEAMPDDLTLPDGIGDVLLNSRRVTPYLFSLVAPLLHRRELRRENGRSRTAAQDLFAKAFPAGV